MSKPENFHLRMGMAMVASCTCGTKTPEKKYHDQDCRFGVLCDCQDYIFELEERLRLMSPKLEKERT
jgi:hypothetical protein